MKRVCLTLLALCLFVDMQVFAQGISQDVSSLKERPDTILIASEPDYPPFCMIDDDGKAVGFAVDLFYVAAESAGMHVKAKVGVWNKIKHDLAEGEIDALPLVGRTSEREKYFDFTMPYLSLHGAVFVRESSNMDINSIEDLKSKEIVVMEGDNAEEFVRRENVSDKIFTVNTFHDAFRMLSNGRHDAVITQRIMGLELLKDLGIDNVHPLDFNLTGFRQDFCFAVQKGDDVLLSRLNEGLSTIIADGTYDDIHYQWFGAQMDEGYTEQEVLRLILYFFVPLVILMSLVWILSLRKEVKRRTRRLHDEIKEHKNSLKELEQNQSLLRESERQIRLLLNSTAEGIYRIDENGICTMVNRAAVQMLGFTSETGLIGKNMHQLMHHTKPDGSAYPERECKIYKALTEGKGVYVNNELFWKSDGSSFPAEYYSFPVIQEGEVIGAVVTFWDITERKRAHDNLLGLKENLEQEVNDRTKELQDKVNKLNRSQKAMLYMVEDLNEITHDLRQERKNLEISNQELEAFTYSVSHDLRAPLRAINGYANFLQEDYESKLDKEGKRYIQVIRNNATRMDDLITDLLKLSRASRAALSLSPVDMTATVYYMYQEVVNSTQENEFEFVVDELPVAYCDSGLIKQVWQNLLGNAVKYSQNAGKKRIEVSAEKANEEILYTVKDYGAGFDEKYKQKLFGIFQRLHAADEFEGNGVGLAIVKRIIDRHGGRLWANGEPGKGAAFSFSVPLKQK